MKIKNIFSRKKKEKSKDLCISIDDEVRVNIGPHKGKTGKCVGFMEMGDILVSFGKEEIPFCYHALDKINKGD